MAERRTQKLSEDTLRAWGQDLDSRAGGKHPRGVAPYANLSGSQLDQWMEYATKNHSGSANKVLKHYVDSYNSRKAAANKQRPSTVPPKQLSPEARAAREKEASRYNALYKNAVDGTLTEETLKKWGADLESRAAGSHPQGAAPYAGLKGKQLDQWMEYATRNHGKAAGSVMKRDVDAYNKRIADSAAKQEAFQKSKNAPKRTIQEEKRRNEGAPTSFAGKNTEIRGAGGSDYRPTGMDWQKIEPLTKEQRLQAEEDIKAGKITPHPTEGQRLAAQKRGILPEKEKPREVPKSLSGSGAQNIKPRNAPQMTPPIKSREVEKEKPADERKITPEPRAAAKQAPKGMVRGSYYGARRTLGERIRNWDWRSNAQIDVDDYNTSLASDKKFAENTAANVDRLMRAGLSKEEATERAAKMEQAQRKAFRSPERSSDFAGRNSVEQELEMQDLERRNAQKPLEARAALQKEQMAENRRLEAIDRRNLGITEGGLQATKDATAAIRSQTDAIAADRKAWNEEREAKRREFEDSRFKKGFVTPELDTDSKLGILGWEARKAGFDKVTDESMRGRFDAAKKQMQIDHEKGIREGRIDPHVQFNPTDDDVINHMRTNLQGSAKRRERSIAAGEQARKQSATEKRAMIKDYGGAIAARSFSTPKGSYNGGFSGGMSQAQMEAKARWDAKRDITSGTRGNLSAFPQQKAYRASPQYGQDVYGMAQQNGRTLTPGSVGSTYEQNYNFNKGLTQAQLDSAKGLANVVDQVPVGGKPTTPQVNGVANTPVTTGADPNKNPLGV